MIAFGFGEILVLALLTSGSAYTDLVALIQPQHYFQTRQIDVSFDKMMELITRDPKDAQTQVMQLTALRYLTDETEKLKRSTSYADYRKIIENVAQGKEAQDSLGFAKEYASRLLAKLDETKYSGKSKASRWREDALAWFPNDATLLFAMEMRQAQPRGAPNDPFKDLLKLIPDQAKAELYSVVEKCGNVRIERLALAFVDNEKDRDAQKIMVRLTGKANRVWLVEAFKVFDRGQFQARESKDAQGVPITILQAPNRAPAFMMIGNTDLLAVGYQKYAGKHEDLVEDILAVRDKKKPSAVTGALQGQLARIPDQAIALLVGEPPQTMKRELGALGVVPAKLVAHIARDPQGLDVNLETTLANLDDANKLVNKVGTLRKEGIDALKQAQQQPLPPGFPPVPFQALINVMESLQVQNQAESVQIRAAVPDSLIQQLGTLGAGAFGMGGGFAPVPVPLKK